MTAEVRQRLDAKALEERALLHGVAHDAETGCLRLVDRVLIEDDAPAIGKPEDGQDDNWFERLHRGIRIRKELVLDDGRSRAAWLTWCGRERDDNDTPLQLSINGVGFTRPPSKHAHPRCKHYYSSEWAGYHFDNWFVAAVPVGALRGGTNVVEMWADSEDTSWEVMLSADGEFGRGSETRVSHPDRSARSTDGGATWDRQRLGWKGELDGEYGLRLSLDRYVQKGVLRSAVLDLAGESGDLRRRLELASSRLQWQVDTTGDAAAQIRVRFGDRPIAGGEGWSAWEDVEGFDGEWSTPARWLQFEASLSTANPLETPVLRGLTIESQVRAPTPRSRLTRCDNGRVERSSVPFTWEDPARLRDLRARFELDRVVDDAATEFEAMVCLMHWAYRIPIDRLDPYAWRFEDLPQLERDEAGQIVLLGPYDRPRREGHCLFCNLTLIAALTSFGHAARWVNISTKHTYGHEVTEVWSNDFDKWVFLDATRDYYIYDPDTGVPLSLTEIGERVAEVLPEPATWDNPIQHQLPADRVVPGPVRVAYRQPEHGGPVFAEDEQFDDMYMIGHLQMPMRNDFASRPHPVPWRLSSNWGSDLFCCWYSEAFPRKLEYGRQVNRRADWEPRLNQAQLWLSETSTTGVLHVDVDTETPWLEAFEARVDGGAWLDRHEPSWDWPAHEGVNRLEVRVRNRHGVRGRISLVEVVQVR
jgi:hypothetical protein